MKEFLHHGSTTSNLEPRLKPRHRQIADNPFLLGTLLGNLGHSKPILALYSL